MIKKLLLFLFLIISCASASAQPFKSIAFFTKRNDQALISFVTEANKWFYKMSQQNNFVYDFTNSWNDLNAEFLKKNTR